LATHICPALSPVRFNNPAFQVMEYNRGNGEIRDMATYYLTNPATAKESRGGRWDLEYDFDSAYGLNGYNAETLRTLTNKIDSDETTRKNFSRFYPVSAPETIKPDQWKKMNGLRLISSQEELDGRLNPSTVSE
jgi:hypothetical protein